ncbi:MAG: hypothetical protein B7Y99_03120 [Caulobacterales bacterium 32-69-10]|nr:MAG: hypothetical protein B7Y99_03120 [Caulobacterales bacterium 32-69-10]
MVEAQNLMENVWVIGDLINTATACRQCYIALAKFGYVKPKDDRPIIDPQSVIDLRHIKNPLFLILEAGLAPALKSELARVDGLIG